MEDDTPKVLNAPQSHQHAHEHAHGEHQHAPHNVRPKANIDLKKLLLNMSYWKAAAIYAVVALIVFYPLFANMANNIPGVGGDPYLNLWSIWWVNYATFTLHTNIYFTTLAFWPVGANLVYQTMPPIFAVLSAPFMAVSIPFAYNVIFLFGFIVAGLTMFALADYLVNNKHAAFIAGIIYSFSAFHIAQAYGHIEWINIGWIALAALFTLKLIRDDKKYYSALGLAVSFVLIFFMEGIESGIMASIFILLIFLAYMINKKTRSYFKSVNLWAAIGAALVLTLVLGSWGFYPIISSVLQPGTIQNANYLNTAQYNEAWSDDLFSFFVPGYFNGFFNGLGQTVFSSIYGGDPSERTSYIGYVALILALIAIYYNYKKDNRVIMWAVIGVVFVLLAFGPQLQVNGYVTPIPSLYQLYHAIPGISVIREPGRFDAIVTLATAVLAAFGAKTLFEMNKDKKGLLGNERMLTAVLAAVILFESAGLPVTASFISQTITTVSVPQIYHTLSTVQGNFSVFSLPAFQTETATPSLYQAQEMYYLISAGPRPLVGGVATRENNTQFLDLYNIPLAVQAANLQSIGEGSYPSPVNQNPTNQTLLTLYNYNTGFVILNKDAYNSSQQLTLYDYLTGVFGNPVSYDNTTVAYETDNAIEHSIYESYVAYPVYSYWQEGQSYINGTATPVWYPINPGPILVYAPYGNLTQVTAGLNSKGSYQTVNSTISFYAFSSSGSGSITLGEETNSGSYKLASFNLTSVPTAFTVNVPMIEGPEGNTFLFIPSQPPVGYNQTSVAVADVTFSKA